MATVPGNALQEHHKNLSKLIRKPSYGVKSIRPGTVVKVFDQDTLDTGTVPGELSRLLITKPGRIYGQVKLDTGELIYLPFQGNPEMIYAIYGDSKMIEGRAVHIVFYDRRVKFGEIVIAPEERKVLTDTKYSTNVFDIGGIFGG